MTQLLLEPARRTGCDDLAALHDVLQAATQRQRSPIDDVLDAGIVDEERYMGELARELGIEWLDSIPAPEVPLPLREACGPRIALRHRLLPVAITGEGDHKRLKLATFDPFNLVARQAAAQELSLPIDWCMASRKRLHESLRRLYGVGADTFEQILEGRDFDYDNNSSSSTRSSARRWNNARPTSTSNRSRPTCASATASTAASSKWRCRKTSRPSKAR